MMDNVLEANVDLRSQLMDDPDIMGGWTGEDWACSYYGNSRDYEGQELTLLLQDTDGKDEIVYIILLPSVAPKHYDAWIRKPGEDSMRLLLRCKAADLYGIYEQLMLRSKECLFDR